MGLKKKLALATGAFVSMSAASLATACPNEHTARRRLRRRRASVPARIVPGTDQSLRVNVQMPLSKARRVPAACSSYKVDVTLLNTLNGAEYIKVEDTLILAGGGSTLEFILDENAPTTVSANVEVTPTDSGACATINPVTSFILVGTDNQGNDNSRTFLPSRELDPVHLRPAAQGGPIIIKDPK